MTCLGLYRSGLLAIASAHGTAACLAQPYWISAEMPHANAAIINVVHTGASGTIYYGGYFDLDPIEPLTQYAVMRYQEGDWDTLWVDCMVVSVLEFHDTLFVAGACGPVNPADTPAVASVKYWDNGTWVQYGVFDTWGAKRLRAIDDTLYCTGGFSVVDGQVCNGIARRIGGQWQSLPVPFMDTPLITDIINFQGDLVICGTALYVDNTSRIARLHGGEWVAMGPGIVGGQSIPRVMREYEGDLYVAGSIYMDEGNPGRDILRWRNGTFEALGIPGLQLYLGDDNGTSTVFDMVVHDSLLFVGGGFRYAGGIEAKGVAIWNGEYWCGVPGNLSEGQGHIACLAMDFYQDTLFVGCGLMADGDTVRYAAKYIGETYQGPCSTADVSEPDALGTLIVYPNPVESKLSITIPAGAKGIMEVFDAVGRLMMRAPTRSTILDVSSWEAGIYILRVADFAPTRLVVE